MTIIDVLKGLLLTLFSFIGCLFFVIVYTVTYGLIGLFLLITFPWCLLLLLL